MPQSRRQLSHLINLSNSRTLNESASNGTEESSDDDFMDTSDGGLSLKEKIQLSGISDLLELCKKQCNSRNLSVLIYLTLKHFDFSWRDIDEFLNEIGGYICETAHKWAQVYIEGDFEECGQEHRGCKQGDSFYDPYPEIEAAAELFVASECSKKSANFIGFHLAQFIDSKFYDLTGQVKSDNKLIRSERMCHLDLRRWGCQFEGNGQRPYFLGHEHDDVVEHRKEFVGHFLKKKNNYYLVSDDENPKWVIPTQDPYQNVEVF